MKKILTLILLLGFCFGNSNLYSVVTMGEDSNLKKTNSLIFKEAKASSLVFVDETGTEFHIKIDKIVKIYDINNNEVDIQKFHTSRGQAFFNNHLNPNNDRERINNNLNVNNRSERIIYVESDTPGDYIVHSANMMFLGDLLPLTGLLVSNLTKNYHVGIAFALVGYGIKLYSYTQLKKAGKKMKKQSSRKLND